MAHAEAVGGRGCRLALAAFEAGADPGAAQRELLAWFLPVLLLSGITFGAGAVCFAVGVSRSGLLATAPARLVAVALIVMALSRFVPLSAVQFYVQGLACYAALLPLAYFMWRRPSVAITRLERGPSTLGGLATPTRI